jgi:hypothetical protein
MEQWPRRWPTTDWTWPQEFTASRPLHRSENHVPGGRGGLAKACSRYSPRGHAMATGVRPYRTYLPLAGRIAGNSTMRGLRSQLRSSTWLCSARRTAPSTSTSAP